jgi:hypothetical protein
MPSQLEKISALLASIDELCEDAQRIRRDGVELAVRRPVWPDDAAPRTFDAPRRGDVLAAPPGPERAN